MHWIGRGIVGAIVLSALAVLPERTGAHEDREILGDRYRLTVGFVTEPPYVGQPNGVDLRVVELVPSASTPPPGTTEDDNVVAVPVRDLQSMLKVEVQTQDAAAPLELQPGSRAGSYRAAFLPTVPGNYTFQITGEIAGQPVEETFGSSPETFPAVAPVTDLQFPITVPVGDNLNARFAETDDDIARTRTLALVAVAAGAVGLLGGGLAIALSRRPPPSGLHAQADRGTGDR